MERLWRWCGRQQLFRVKRTKKKKFDGTVRPSKERRGKLDFPLVHGKRPPLTRVRCDTVHGLLLALEASAPPQYAVHVSSRQNAISTTSYGLKTADESIPEPFNKQFFVPPRSVHSDEQAVLEKADRCWNSVRWQETFTRSEISDTVARKKDSAA